MSAIEQVQEQVQKISNQADKIFLGADMKPLSEADLATAVRFVIKQLRELVK